MATLSPLSQTKDVEDDEDPFDSLLSLEQTYYQNGYEEGYADGQRQARIEARLFGVQTAFNKFATAGRMHARAEIWAGRLGMSSPVTATLDSGESSSRIQHDGMSAGLRLGHQDCGLPMVSRNSRLEKHVETMLSLVEGSQLPQDNSDASVAEVDVRLRRATAKEKVIEKMTGDETNSAEPLEVEITLEQQQHSSIKPDEDAINFEDFGRASSKHSS